MGIRGLTTFIDSHPHLLTDYQLHDTRLVIDGNNLYHFLYYQFRVPHEYGGDYDNFSRSCATFFATLRSCHVDAYVVFDGAYAADGSKFKTSMERAHERIRLAGLIAGGGHAKILPILAHEAFCSALRKLGVPHVTYDFEADRQVAALANHWNCAVLTNDSDFFIYNVHAGVILLDYANLHIQKSRSSGSADVEFYYLSVQIFYAKKMLKFLEFSDHKLVVLLATLLGNDIVDRRNFAPFFAGAKLPKASKRYMGARRLIKIASLITWLQSVQSLSDAVAYILSLIPDHRRDRVSALVNQSLECYTNLSSEIHGYFETTATTDEAAVMTRDGNPLPDWFIQSIRSCIMPVALLNVVVNRHIILLSQVEYMTEASSYCCSRPLRQIAYGILLSIDAEANSDLGRVDEYDRDHKVVNRVVTEPIFQVCSKRVPHLGQIPCVEQSNRFSFLLEALGMPLELASPFSCEVSFLVAVVRYWITHASTKLLTVHLHALLLCFLKLGALDRQIQFHSGTFRKTQSGLSNCVSECSVTNLSVNDTEQSLTGEENTDLCSQLVCAKSKLQKFSVTPRHNRSHAFDAAIIHSYSQFQSCLQAAIYIAKLLYLSEAVLDPAVMFCGTLLYNLFRDLRGRSNPALYIADLLGQSSEITAVYMSVFEAIQSGLPEDCLEATCAKAKKRTKKKKVPTATLR